MDKVIITLRIEEDIKKELDMIALEEDRSVNNLITRILKRYLEELKNK